MRMVCGLCCVEGVVLMCVDGAGVQGGLTDCRDGDILGIIRDMEDMMNRIMGRDIRWTEV